MCQVSGEEQRPVEIQHVQSIPVMFLKRQDRRKKHIKMRAEFVFFVFIFYQGTERPLFVKSLAFQIKGGAVGWAC